jgi:small-conductance mechanosensitive channel
MKTIINIILFIVITSFAVVVGYIVEKLFLNKLKKKATQTKWIGDDIIINSLEGIIWLLFGIIGFFIALTLIPIPEKLGNFLEKVSLIATIVAIIIFLLRISLSLVEFYTKNIQDVVLATTSIFKTIVKIVILTIGFLILLQAVGISITPILTTLGIGGLAVALALQDTLANLFAGFYISISKQIRVGDRIKLENGEEGYVKDITWRNTTIQTPQNNLLIIPNSKLSSLIITNYYLPEPATMLVIPVSVSYDSDLKHVEKVTIEVAKEVLRTVPGGVIDFEPLIRFQSFGDSGINFLVIIKVQDFNSQFPIRNEFIKNLHQRYKIEGINIPYPTRTVYIHKTD